MDLEELWYEAGDGHMYDIKNLIHERYKNMRELIDKGQKFVTVEALKDMYNAAMFFRTELRKELIESGKGYFDNEGKFKLKENE